MQHSLGGKLDLRATSNLIHQTPVGSMDSLDRGLQILSDFSGGSKAMFDNSGNSAIIPYISVIVK